MTEADTPDADNRHRQDAGRERISDPSPEIATGVPAQTVRRRANHETQTARGAVFLEKQGYRRRRLMDAARLLPILGAVLMMVPLLWPSGEDGIVATSRAMLFIFSTWAALIVLSFLFGLAARALGQDEAAQLREPEE